MDIDRRKLITSASALVMVGAGSAHAQRRARAFSVAQDTSAVLIKDPEGRSVARYLYGPLPTGEKSSSAPFTDYTHPIWTPAGTVVTDVGPVDHPRHRGVFCAWVDVSGEARGDWLGWGARAPLDGRVIVSRSAQGGRRGAGGRILARNDWMVGSTTVLHETVELFVSQAEGHQLLDYRYRYAAPTSNPVILGQQAFGGFFYRAKSEGEVAISSPAGLESRANSNANKLELNWPSQPWYDLSTRTADGRVAGAAILDHPSNPKSSWHGVRSLYILNPCVCAPAPVTIVAGRPLELRYRMAVHDGPADAATLNRLHRDFART